MKSPVILKSILIFSFLVSAASASAEFFRGPISSAMGGAGRAGLASSEGAFLNPAVIPLVKNHEFIGFYRDGYVAPGEHRQGWAVGVVDNSEGVLFPGAAHYGKIRDTGRSDSGIHGEIWHLAAAYLLNDQVSFGVSGYRLQYKSKGDRAFTQWNATLGLVALINENLSFAYVFDNLAHPFSETPTDLREDSKHTLALFGRMFDVMALRIDVQRESERNPNDRLTYMAGFESMTSEFFTIRMGYRLDDLRSQRFATAGFGFNGPRLKVDYSFEKPLEGTSGALHSVDLRVPF